MHTAICLFTTTWENEFRNISPISSEAEQKVCSAFRLLWEELARSRPDLDFLLIMPGVLDSKDWYPVSFRRFVRIGTDAETFTRNAMELLYEKGYNRVVFVESFLVFPQPGWLLSLVAALEKQPVAMVPDDSGRIAGLALSREALQSWNFFGLQQPEAVVEALSDCMGRSLPYALLDSVSCAESSLHLQQLIRSLS
jgi:hypothetical protein